MLEKISKVVKWENIEALLLEHYEIGTSKEGADAFPPLLLLKCMLLQKWFRISSDPELETQINDRISFKKFLGLTLDIPSPLRARGRSEPAADHSTFSKFRNRISKKAMVELNNAVPREMRSLFNWGGVAGVCEKRVEH